MCGIAGRVNRDHGVGLAQLEAMSQLIMHRGPDGQGMYRDHRVGLVHRRLAIVDREGGAQPVFGERGRVVVVYNGEIYNHAELRPRLEALGHVFSSACDTEVIVHAHEEQGPAAARSLRGMFAYAAWEPSARRLTLVRDRLGIKPLFYSILPSGDLLFASELKALLVEPEVDRRIDEEALCAYLALRYVPAPATILRGVRKLMPGCTLTWQGGRVSEGRYWHVPLGNERDPRDVPPPPPTYAEAGGRLCQLLDEVVEARLMGEVPIGAFLSGGLDSSLVSALLAEQARKRGGPPPSTFSVGYAGEGTWASDELEWARRVASLIGSRHREIVITGEQVAGNASRIAWSLDEPLGDPAAAPLWFLARRARQEVTVVLSGEGADEVLAGYAIYGHAVQAARLRKRAGVESLARLALGACPKRGRSHKALSLLAAPVETRYHGVARALDDETRMPWGDVHAVDRLLAPAWTWALGARSTLGRMLAFDQQAWLADDLLAKADKTTMAHALELRVPLLDYRLVEEIAGWPDEWKLSGREGKKILRHAADGLVPREVLTRPKMGFATPAAAWLRGAMRRVLIDAVLSSVSQAAERGMARHVERMLNEHLREKRDRSPELWALLALELFLQDVVPKVATVPADLGAAGDSLPAAG